jgi:cyclohexa-1,5-dienecarbonyl-CoA hydratase
MATQSAAQSVRVSCEIQRPIARLVLGNPPLNVIDVPMMDELAGALRNIESHPEISLVMVSGAGSCFSVGVDVAAHEPDAVNSMLEKFHHVIRALVSTTKITMASVRGHCLGGAAELAMVCDFVYTTEDAKWGFPEIQLGCFPPVAVTALAALIGQKPAADLILTGRTFSGNEAATIGLASRAVSEGELDRVLGETRTRLAALSPAALAITKKAIYLWDAIHLDKGLTRAERVYLDELMKTEDAREGIRAFIEKRRPQWKGR